MMIATARASAGIEQIPVTGNVRVVLASSAGPPEGPGGSRVSATRHGATVKNAVWMPKHAENSEVLPSPAVAVAVSFAVGETATGNVALQLPSQPAPGALIVAPRKFLPSPLPEASQASLAKTSIRKEALAVLFKVPSTVTEPAVAVADVITGKFWRLLEPVSASQASLGVTPFSSMSIPRPPLE